MKISIFTQKIKNPLYQALDNYIRMLCMKNQPILITTAWEKLALLKRREGQKSEKSEKKWKKYLFWGDMSMKLYFHVSCTYKW